MHSRNISASNALNPMQLVYMGQLTLLKKNQPLPYKHKSQPFN